MTIIDLNKYARTKLISESSGGRGNKQVRKFHYSIQHGFKQRNSGNISADMQGTIYLSQGY